MKRSLITMFILLSTCLGSLPAQAVTEASGNLETFLKDIDYGAKESNSWVQPSAQQVADFTSLFHAFLSGDYETAHQLGSTLGYEVIHYQDSVSGKAFYLLFETNQLPSTAFIGGGTYVIQEQGVNAVLQAPHPQYDSYTGSQAIETFLKANTKFLMLAGTRRDNHTNKSPCTDGDYQSSDVSHQTQSLFQVVHQILSDADYDTVFIQLHGFGSATLATLQKQCASSNSKLINLSEGINYATSPAENSLMQIMRNTVEAGGQIKACVYGNDTQSLGGTWNVQARHTNGSADNCLSNATVSSKRFVHLEQSYSVRKYSRDTMADYIASSLNTYFSK